jgi:hypothetical protein
MLINEPARGTLAAAIHYLKLSFAKRAQSMRAIGSAGPFWQKRYYDRNGRNERESSVKLRENLSPPRLAPKEGTNLGHQADGVVIIARRFNGGKM